MRVIELRDGATIEMDMRAVQRRIAGTDLSGIAYGGSIPGPVLRVGQGSRVDLVLHNNTDAETTLHPHGLRLDWRYDGVPHLGQHPVPPGGEFTYRLTFPDAGVYWYHPHVRDWSVRDQGAYGVFVVQPTDPAYYNPVNREEVLALDDILLDHPSSTAGGHGPATHVYRGMFGETMLVNGRADYALRVQKGEVVRFQVLNAADARVFNLAFPGARLKVIGSDVGKNEREQWADTVMIAPAERYTVEVLFTTPGVHEIVSKTSSGTRVLGRVEVDPQPISQSHAASFERLREHADVRAEIDRVRPYFDKPVDKRLAVELELGARGGMSRETQGPLPAGGTHVPRPLWERTDAVAWEDPSPEINGQSTAESTLWKLVDADTGKENEEIQWTFTQGDVVKIEVQGGPLQHPIHFHGQRFLVLSIDGEANPNLQWKDTFLLPAGKTAQILLEATNPGKWMFHCHIGRHSLDQPSHRMTGFFEVRGRPPGGER